MKRNLCGLSFLYLYMYNNLESSKFQAPSSKQYLITQILNSKLGFQRYLGFGILGFGAYRAQRGYVWFIA